MAVMPHDRPRVLAVLGPTNTGKTHFAIERMLAHPSGLIGLPLRLLAREIYDRIAVAKGSGAVALITGEEKIQPPGARYWVATVEAMPEDLAVSFLAVDEIQLCADRERGHVFTDRLLRARGQDETMFLGADTIRPLLRQLVPEAEIIARPRFSTLSYAEPAKVTRLPRRSAVVAFTSQDVYALAELVRQHRGGAAVVLGALSPRTRNAQVALYQAGEVDYLIATDAIGMGLNMDVAHVALASTQKFDGLEWRMLRPPELGQIVGRAGRHMRDGTFGTTIDVGGLDERTVQALEQHDFPALRELRWRNAELDLSSLDALQESLDAAPPFTCLRKTGDALDHVSLKLLARREPVRARAASPAGVRLLWAVCQIPDFRKTLTEAHLHLLDTVFEHLAKRGRLPIDWVADQVARLEAVDGDLDTLISRLAHIRTWTYVAHHSDWLADAGHWQERTRAVEDRLSDALHERLTQRFIDRRTQAVLRSLRDGPPLGVIEPDGAIVIEGQVLGRVDGLRVALRPAGTDIEKRTLARAARRLVGPELRRRAQALIEAPDAAFALADDGTLLWRCGAAAPARIGRLLPGLTALAPRIEVWVGDQIGGDDRGEIQRRLGRWLEAHLQPVAGLLGRLQAAPLNGPGRGLAFRLAEGLGSIRRAEAEPLLKDLGGADRSLLGKLGVRFGVRHCYLPALLKGRAVDLRALLWRVHGRQAALGAPVPGRVTLPRDAGRPDAYAEGFGFEPLAGLAMRIDIVERLGARLRAATRAGPAELSAELMGLTGLGRAELGSVVQALGFAVDEAGRIMRGKPPQKARRRAPSPGEVAGSPFAALRQIRLGA
jgi:ATP-dependent RNA helicase SUPV3L1/SUV3